MFVFDNVPRIVKDDRIFFFFLVVDDRKYLLIMYSFLNVTYKIHYIRILPYSPTQITRISPI